MFRKNNLDKTIEKAQNYLQKGKVIKAKDTYLKALALNPDNLTVLNNLTQIYNMLDEEDNAKGYSEILLKECNKILRHEKDERILIFKVNALTILEKDNELNKTLDEILKINPKNTIALFHKANNLGQSKQYSEALKYIERVLKEEQYNIMALLLKGRVLVGLNNLEKAEDCYNLVLEIEPKNKMGIYLKSELLKKKTHVRLTSHDLMLKAVENMEMKNFETSTDYFKKALAIDSTHDEIWFVQGELFVRTGRIDDAINSYKKAFEINPHSGGIAEPEKFFKMLNRMRKIDNLFRFKKWFSR